MAQPLPRPTALVASTAEAAQAAAAMLKERYDFASPAKAELIIALGGDGFMLHTLHKMLRKDRICPVFGMNRGTVGFLMNEWRIEALAERVERARPFSIAPLQMKACRLGGDPAAIHA